MNLTATTRSRTGNLRLLLKLFLPSWNFFNDFAEVSRLDFCEVAPGRSEGFQWQPLHPSVATRSWMRVLWNPAGNLELLEKSLIDRIATALREQPVSAELDFERSEAGVILRRMVQSRLPKCDASERAEFCYRLLIVAPDGSTNVLFTSGVQRGAEGAR